MKSLFLLVDGIGVNDSKPNQQALTWSVTAALQRNKVYKSDENYGAREQFRMRWESLLCEEAESYRNPMNPISDDQHCAAISRIADSLSNEFGDLLEGGRVRFGTSQKAFNLYLKYLWALNEIGMPPHCPIDSVVLAKAGIYGSWTKCDSSAEYMGWIDKIREHLNLTEWENEVWLRWRVSNWASEPSSHIKDTA